MSRSNQLAGLLTADPPNTLDTINEINTALGNDANLATTLTNSIATKASKSGDTFTGNVIVNKAGTTTEPTMRVTSALESSSGIHSHGFSATFLNTSNNANAHGVAIGSKHADSNSLIIGQHDTTFDHFIVKGDGNVGIGVDPSTKLHVYDADDHTRLSVQCANSNGRHWQFQSRNDGVFWIRDDTAGSNRMVFDTAGKVGIGTSNITGGLHVYDDRDITNNPDGKGIRLDESSGKWLLSLGQAGTSNTSFGIRDVTNSKYPIIIQSQTNAGSTPAINIYNDGRVDFDKAIFAEALRTLYLGRNTTLTINPYTQLGQYGQGGVFYVSFGSWPGNAGLFQVRWHNAGGNGGITYSSYDVIVRSSTALGLTVSHAQNSSIYDSTISITSVGHHSNSHGWAGGVVNFCRYDS